MVLRGENIFANFVVLALYFHTHVSPNATIDVYYSNTYFVKYFDLCAIARDDKKGKLRILIGKIFLQISR